jgi:hypothetical protein
MCCSGSLFDAELVFFCSLSLAPTITIMHGTARAVEFEYSAVVPSCLFYLFLFLLIVHCHRIHPCRAVPLPNHPLDASPLYVMNLSPRSCLPCIFRFHGTMVPFSIASAQSPIYPSCNENFSSPLAHSALVLIVVAVPSRSSIGPCCCRQNAICQGRIRTSLQSAQLTCNRSSNVSIGRLHSARRLRARQANLLPLPPSPPASERRPNLPFQPLRRVAPPTVGSIGLLWRRPHLAPVR